MSTQASETRPHRGHDAATWRRVLQLVVLVAASSALFFWPFLELVHVRESNVEAHIGWAKDIARTGVLYPGHFLYHILTVFVHGVSSVTWQLTWDQANVIVMVGAKALTAVILWVLIRRAMRSRDTTRDSLTVVLLPIALLFASAISVFTWEKGNYYLGYIPLPARAEAD